VRTLECSAFLAGCGLVGRRSLARETVLGAQGRALGSGRNSWMRAHQFPIKQFGVANQLMLARDSDRKLQHRTVSFT
jgi:hypothetical protein